MDIRSTIREKPILVGTVAVAACVFGFAFLGWQVFGSRSNPQLTYAGKAFFSDDDGKTWFIDDESKLPPFDHNGRQAYRAVLYRCATGKPFVAYLERYSSSDLAKLAEMRKAALARDPNSPTPTLPPGASHFEVKKPGEAKWVAVTAGDTGLDAADYQRVTHPVCPDGSASVTQVQPYDSDAQHP